MTEEVSANSGEQVENTETNNEATTATTAEVTDVQVEAKNNSETEDEQTTDEVKNLEEQIKTLNGKLKTIRDNADKNGANVKSLAVENLRLKAVLTAGLSADDLILVNGKTEDEISKQIERVKQFGSSNRNQNVLTLQGQNSNVTRVPSAMERQISEQLAKFNQ